MNTFFSAASKRAAFALFFGLLGLLQPASSPANPIFEYQLPTVGAAPVGITLGPDGAYWFAEFEVGKIGRITTNGAISEISVLTTNGQPYDITTGPDGAMWFTETATNKLGRVDTALTTVTEYALPTNITGFTADYPAGILLGPDSNIWYTDPQASYVTRVNLTSNQVTMVVTTNIITNFNSTVTTNIATNANATQFFTPTTNSFPERLATGPDGNIWFGEFVGNYPAYFNFIGRFIFPVPLNIQLITNSQVVLSWTTNATTNFVLQTNSDLTTTNWGFATNAPAVVGTNYVVTNQVGASNLFFRLIE